MPTEAEWEYACRGAPTTQEECAFDFYFDRPSNDLSSDQTNFDGRYPAGKARKGKYLRRTMKVGSYKPNRLGLCDMHGNVWDWCDELYKGGPARVLRGGDWDCYASDCRASSRFGNMPTERYYDRGLRLAAVPSDG